MIAYCEYNAPNGKQLAISGIPFETLRHLTPNATWFPYKAALHLVNRAPKKGDLCLVEGVLVDPCESCKHRLRDLTGGCKACHFQLAEDRTPFDSEDYWEQVLRYLKEENVQKISIRHLVKNSDFVSYFTEDELSFYDEDIEENKKSFQDRAQKAVQSKRYKKEKCATCAYQCPFTTTCLVSEPRFCRYYSHYKTEAELEQKALSYVKDAKRLLSLSLLCGRIFKWEGRRHRLSYVKNEITGTFVATLDYAPWSTIELTWESVVKLIDGAQYVHSSSDILELSDEEAHKKAAVYALIRKNWHTIRSIDKHQKQHMFFATFNPRKTRIDIEIHLSKNTYPYSYKNLKELVTTTHAISS